MSRKTLHRHPLVATTIGALIVVGVVAATVVVSDEVAGSPHASAETARASAMAPAAASTTPAASLTTPTATASAAPASTTTATPSASPTPTAPAVDGTELQAALTKAQQLATARGETSAVEVLDRDTGTVYSAGDTTRQYQSASVVKVFIAAQLILSGQMSNPDTEATAYEMITRSDDDSADALYGLVGGDNLVYEIEKEYDLTGLAPPPVAGSWGSTYITADAMIKFYQEVATQPQVSSWLLNAMSNTQQTAADGTDQYFGIPAATSEWKIKQGWVCCEENVSGVNSTGYVGNDRFVVVILTEGTPSEYLSYEQDTIDQMAQTFLTKAGVVGL